MSRESNLRAPIPPSQLTNALPLCHGGPLLPRCLELLGFAAAYQMAPNLQQLVTAEEAAVQVLLKIRELIDAIEHAADLAEAAGYQATATTLRQEAQNLQPRLQAAQANLDTARAAIQDYWDTDEMNA